MNYRVKQNIEDTTGITEIPETVATNEGYELATMMPADHVCDDFSKCESYAKLTPGEKCPVPHCIRDKPKPRRV